MEGDSCCVLVKEIDELFQDNNDITQLKESLVQSLSNFKFSFCKNMKYMNFSPHRYTRNLVALKEKYSLLINCWNYGQKSARRVCSNKEVKSYLKVLYGTLKISTGDGEEIILTPNDPAYVYSSEDGKEICLENITKKEGDNSNNSGDSPADSHHQGKCISLHLYTPPHLQCSHSSNSQNVEGEESTSGVPVIFCCESNDKVTEKKDIEIAAALKDRNVFTNLTTLVQVLRKEIRIDDEGRHSPENINHISAILRLFHFHDLEWKQYENYEVGRYTRNLIGYHSKFSMLLLCWEKSQRSPIHDHAGSNCWVKVLKGHLREEIFTVNNDNETVSEARTLVYGENQVTYISDAIGVHRMGNDSDDEVAVSLHVYSPPYHKCNMFDQRLGVKREVSITTAYGSCFPFMKKNLQNDSSLRLSNLRASQQKNNNNEGERLNLEEYLRKLAEICSKDCYNLCEHKFNTLLSSLYLSYDEWEKFIHFSQDRYTRNLIAINDCYSLILNCFWGPQKIPVHKHGDIGKVWIKVLEGELIINQYDPTHSEIINTIHLRENEYILLSNQELGHHETINGTDKSCITLHLYTPPYLSCSFYCKDSNQIRQIPVTYCSIDDEVTSSSSDSSSIVNHQHHHEQDHDHHGHHEALMTSLSSNEDHRLEALERECKISQFVFTNFSSFLDLLSHLFSSLSSPSSSPTSSSLLAYFSECPIENITQIINRVQFHPKEWKAYATSCSLAYTRNLIAKRDLISIYLNVFKPGQSSKIHDHGGSKSWIKVLEGELSETQFLVSCESYDDEHSSNVLLPHHLRAIKLNNTIYIPPDTIHKTENISDKPVYSLHIYYPDFTECNYYEQSSGKAGTLFCDCHLSSSPSSLPFST